MSNTATFTVEGMCCAAETIPIERAVRALPGVSFVNADAALARLTVTYDTAALAPERIVAQVERLGIRVAVPPAPRTAYSPAAAGGAAQPARGGRWLALRDLLRRPRDLLTLLCGALILLAWVGPLLGLPAQAGSFLYILATLLGGIFVARSGWATLIASRVLDINILMTIAAIGALLLGEYAEGASVVFLFALGNALESYTMERSRRSIRALMQLAPETALVVRDGVEQLVAAEAVAVGELFSVRPGERIALDGVVVTGHSQVNQAPITGESTPVEKQAGGEVFAGSINGEGVLDVRATRPAKDSTLARIIHLVEQAQSHKAPSQRFVDVFARYYTPIVFALAALVALLPPLLMGGWSEWIYRALVLLVIACPCALVVSTPVSIVSAISAAARAGVLFKGGASLEAAGGLRALAFDKTGTLTSGHPAVTHVLPLEVARPLPTAVQPIMLMMAPPAQSAEEPACCHHCSAQATPATPADPAGDALLRAAAAVERRSTHPLARAIVSAAELRALDLPAASDFQSRSGRGASAMVEGRAVRVGNRAMFAGQALSAQVLAQLEQIERDGSTAMLVERDGALIGLIGAADVERSESHGAIDALHALGIGHIAMLTGDTAPIARRVAAHTGVDATHAELLPEQKLEVVDDLLARYGQVGMVGDGVNDAPALARATVGVAMGVAGSDAALETADITLMSDDLGRLPFAINLSRATRRIILQNVTFALVIKLLFLVATLFGVATLWMAVLADSGAALLVIANGMRLLRYRPAAEAQPHHPHEPPAALEIGRSQLLSQS